MSRFRHFVFTSYDVTDEFKELALSLDFKYIVLGLETCPKTKRLHYQSYAESANPRTRKAFQKMFKCMTLHIEPRKDTPLNCSKYCKKDGDFFERGELSKQGKRNDISVVKDLIKDGSNLRDILEDATSYQSIRTAEKMLVYFEPKRNWVPEVYWFHGTTGTGKSRRAHELCTDPWVSSDGLKWFQGYDAHSDVIFDDFRPSFCSFPTLLRLLDRYAFQVECKGASRQFLAKRIFITCSQSPYDLYFDRGFDDKEISQLLRRITEIKIFT